MTEKTVVPQPDSPAPSASNRPDALSQMGQPESQWATLTLRGKTHGVTREMFDAIREQLDTLGGLLMVEPDVGGVELRDPSSPEAPPLELVIYTVPAALESLTTQAQHWLDTMGLHATIESHVHQGEDWKDTWKQYYRPLVFGRNTLLVRPSWLDRPAGAPSLELIIDPGRAFGTGLHETTHLCLDWLCALYERGHRPQRMLDLGCGSGILSLAAAVLFPTLSEVFAIDFDAEAAETTRENAEINDLTSRITTATGTLDDVQGSFDLIVANIRSEVLIPAAAGLRRHVTSDALIVLSGILDLERERVEAAYRDAGWSAMDSHARGSWVALGWKPTS